MTSLNLLHDRFDVSTEHGQQLPDDDEWSLLQRVLRALDLDPALDVSDVDVAIDHDRVILSGSVPGHATKTRIVRVVLRVEGVAAVETRLAIGLVAA